MVAASKLRRAREAAEAARPYATAMERMVSRLASGYQGRQGPTLLSGTGNDKNHLIIVATADRGLCGAFNSSITRASRKKIKELQAEGKNVKIYCVGKKSRDLLQNDFGKLFVGVKTDIAKKTVQYVTAESIAEDVLAIFEREQIDVVTIVYNHFKSAIQQIVTFQQLIPLTVASDATTSDTPYEYEPEEEEILADLLPRNFAMQIFKSLLENGASEQGARMNAMESATKNAGEMIKKITLKYNRTRQANITKELIEIISGAEAV